MGFKSAFTGLIKICKTKTDFQLWHYIEVSGQTHAPAALPAWKDPKNAENSRLSGPHGNNLKKSFYNLNSTPPPLPMFLIIP
jgi:hypothetical protein